MRLLRPIKRVMLQYTTYNIIILLCGCKATGKVWDQCSDQKKQLTFMIHGHKIPSTHSKANSRTLLSR